MDPTGLFERVRKEAKRTKDEPYMSSIRLRSDKFNCWEVDIFVGSGNSLGYGDGSYLPQSSALFSLNTYCLKLTMKGK